MSGGIIPTGGAGGGGTPLTIENEGTALPIAATALNFVGSGVTASGSDAEKTISIPGNSSAGVYEGINVIFADHAALGTEEYLISTATEVITITFPPVSPSVPANKRWFVFNDGTQNINFVAANGALITGNPTLTPGNFAIIALQDDTIDEVITVVLPGISSEGFSENIQDIVGAMFSGNTESDITVSYEDSDGTIDLNVYKSRLGDTRTPVTYQGQATITLAENQLVSPGRRFIFQGTTSGLNNTTINLVSATSLDDIGKFWLFTNDSPSSLSQTFSAGTNITVNGNNTEMFPAGMSCMLRIRNYTAGSPSTTEYEIVALAPTQASGSGAGGSGSSGSSSSPLLARNEESTTLVRGSGVNVNSADGNIALIEAGLGPTRYLNAFTLEDIVSDAEGAYTRFGPVTTSNVWDVAIQRAAPVAEDTVLYWNEVLRRVVLDSQSGAHKELGKVLSSRYALTETTTNSNQTISTQVLWDNWHTKTHTSTSNVEYALPDISEGVGEVTVVPGQRFIIAKPQGGGTATISFRGGVIAVAGYPGSHPVYNSSTPLAITGATRAEAIMLEVDSNGTGYIYRELNQHVLQTVFFFDWTAYQRLRSSSERTQVSNQVQSLTQDVNTLENPIRTRIDNTNYTIGAVLGSGPTHLVNENATQVRTWTFGLSNGIPNNTTELCMIDNTESAFGLELTTQSGVDFSGMSCPRLLVLPGEVREIIVAKDGGTLQFIPVGSVKYNFTLTSSDVNDTNGYNLSDVPAPYSVLFETPGTGAVDRLVFRPNVAGDVSMRLEYSPSWGGSSGTWPEHTNLQTRMDDNGNTGPVSVVNTVFHAAATAISPFSYEFKKTGLTGNQWINPVTTNLSASTNLLDVQAHFEIILKET